MTTGVGALARFEETFGFLWGHGKEEISEEEAEWRDLWEECRTAILDLVHEQISSFDDKDQ